MAIVDATRELEPRERLPIGWDGRRLDEMRVESERLFAETGSHAGLTGELELKNSDPIGYEKLFGRMRGEGLNVVRRRADGQLISRSDAGHDFCRFDQNWKAHAPVFVRDSDELLQEIHPRMAHCDVAWMELREFYRPRSGRLPETEAVTPGDPVVHDFLPDIEGFYRGWLGREVP